MPRIEVRTTISAMPYFFCHVHLMAAALSTGSPGLDFEIVVSVGGGSSFDPADEPIWARRYPIRWRRVDPARYAAVGYVATNDDRVSFPSDADILVLADSDLLPIADWTPLVNGVLTDAAIAGVMAGVQPFGVELPDAKSDPANPSLSPAPTWSRLARAFGMETLPLQHELIGWNVIFDDERLRYAPAYFNGGFVIGSCDRMLEMFQLFPDAQRSVMTVVKTPFTPQIARTLSIYKAGIPHRLLPLRYNFPNDPRFDAAAPTELASAINLHFLRKEIIHKHKDFSSLQSLSRLIDRRDLTGSNEILRNKVGTLFEQILADVASL